MPRLCVDLDLGEVGAERSRLLPSGMLPAGRGRPSPSGRRFAVDLANGPPAAWVGTLRPELGLSIATSPDSTLSLAAATALAVLDRLAVGGVAHGRGDRRRRLAAAQSDEPRVPELPISTVTSFGSSPERPAATTAMWVRVPVPRP